MEPSILNKFLPKTEEKRDYFLALEIDDEKIKTAACEIKKGEVEILGLGVSFYQGSWEEAIVAADEAIAQVEPKFSQELSVDKVILGLPTEYTKDGKIEETRLLPIKELLEKLSLKAVGFVEIPLAIIHFLQKEEGGPPTLILVKVGKNLAVSLVRVGKITNSLSLPRTENLALDLEKALAYFETPVLPSRILLYNGQQEVDLEKVKQELMNYPWLNRASFLHFPKIEVAPSDLDIKSVAFAGASEMAQVVEIREKEESKQPSDFGFVREKDILEEEKPQPSEFTPPVSPPLGKEELSIESKRLPLLSITLPRINLPQFLSIEKLKVLIGQKIGLGILIGGFLLFLGGGGLLVSSFYLPSVKVNLLLKSQVLNQPIEVTVNPKSTIVDEAKKEIPGLVFETEEKETKKTTTTGRKTIGEPARGEVTIYNKTTNSKTFKKGTIILSPNNLKFSLDDDVTVASASEDIRQRIFGKANVHVTATTIGPEGNLGVDQIFSFTDDPQKSFYVAQNSVAFSGGSSREISVGRADQERLIASVSAELTETAKRNLEAKLKPGEKILDRTLSGTVIQKKFDKEVDEEGTELSLEMTMHFTIYGFRENDLWPILEKTVANSVPLGFDIRKTEVKMEIVSFEKKKDGSFALKTNFTVPLSPKVNEEEIKKNLKGKTLKEAENYLRGLGNLAGFEIKFLRTTPLLRDRLPSRSQNIKIETQGYKE